MNHLENTKIALRYWLTIPDENVVKNLNDYKTYYDLEGSVSIKHDCNTIACFGGWIPAMPEFAAMGVTFNEYSGLPILEKLCGYNVAGELFGERTIFCPTKVFCANVFGTSFNCKYDHTAKPGISDHKLVTHRLKEHIKRLEAVA